MQRRPLEDRDAAGAPFAPFGRSYESNGGVDAYARKKYADVDARQRPRQKRAEEKTRPESPEESPSARCRAACFAGDVAAVDRDAPDGHGDWRVDVDCACAAGCKVAGAGGLLERDRDVRSSALPGALQRLDKSNRYPVLFFAPEMKALATLSASRNSCRTAMR